VETRVRACLGLHAPGFARRVASLAAFGVIYSTLMILGLFLRESSQQLTSSGPPPPACSWRSGFRRAQLDLDRGHANALEIAIDFRAVDHFTLRTYGPFIVANSLGRHRRRSHCRFDSWRLPEISRIRHVCQFFAAVALGRRGKRGHRRACAAQPLGAARYFREWQLWGRGTAGILMHRTGVDVLAVRCARAASIRFRRRPRVNWS